MLIAEGRRAVGRPILLFHLAILFHLFYSAEGVRCPGPCKCIEENDGERLELVCDQGGIHEKTFQKILERASTRTTHIRIIGPADNPNVFSISSNLKRFRNLEELHLVNCGMTSLGQGLFAPLPSLRTLNVADNRIKYVSHDTFIGAGHLEHLYLDGNLFARSNLPSGAFTYLKNLRTLSLKRNNIARLPFSLFVGLEGLRTLSLSGTKLDADFLAALLSDVPGLEELELNGCCLRDLKTKTFSKVPNLHRLEVGGNQLTYIPVHAFEQLHQLQHLSLAGNNISYVPAFAFSRLPIGNLDLSDNDLGSRYKPNSVPREGEGITPRSFANSSLVRLDLSNNGFHEFNAERILGDAGGSLRVLSLSENPLKTIKEEQTRSLSLKVLHVARIQMNTLPERLPDNFQHLQLLNLSGNGISNLPFKAAKQLAPSLRHLDISNCQFSRIDSSVFSVLVSNLVSLYAYGNPWDCSCHISQLRNYFQDPKRVERCKLLQLERIHCATPVDYAEKELVTLEHPSGCAVIFDSRSGLTQESEIGILVAGALAIFLLISLGILIACWSKLWRKAGTYRTREDSRNQLSPSDSDHSDMILPQPPPSSAKERLF